MAMKNKQKHIPLQKTIWCKIRYWQLLHDWTDDELAMYLNWQLWTLVGIGLGQNVPGLAELGLDFAMVATFAAIVAPQLRQRPVAAAALLAGALALLARELPYKLGLMLAALAGVAVGVLLDCRRRRLATEERV